MEENTKVDEEVKAPAMDANQEWLVRLVQERDMLAERLHYLMEGLKKEEIPEADKHMMEKQSHPMKYYLEVLNMRIGMGIKIVKGNE